jgi:hypothetical protein
MALNLPATPWGHMNFSKLLTKEITISLVEDGFVSKTRHARFFSTSELFKIRRPEPRPEEPLDSGSVTQAHPNSKDCDAACS